jgi:hypothetical protein
MMLPNQAAMATTRQGGSMHQQGVVLPQQSTSFAAAHAAPVMAQGVNGLQDAARQAMQAGRTERHALVQAEQNFAPQVPEHAARNAQKIAAQKLSMLYRGGLFASGAVDGSSMARLGQLLSRRMG